MNIKDLLEKLKNEVGVKTQKELCAFFDWSEPAVSGWIKRNAVGALVDNLLAVGRDDLIRHIFKVDNNINTGIVVHPMVKEAFLTKRQKIAEIIEDELDGAINSEIIDLIIENNHEANEIFLTLWKKEPQFLDIRTTDVIEIAKKYMSLENATKYAELFIELKTLDEKIKNKDNYRYEEYEHRRTYLKSQRHSILSEELAIDSLLRKLISTLKPKLQ